jgi:adenosine/AMP kinase
MNLNIANNNLSNMGQGFTFVITLDSNFNFNDLVRIYENSYFEQSVNNITTQFNQIIVSFTDSYGNWVPLNSLYTITLELV